MVSPADAPRRVRKLPDLWVHRTPTATYVGPLGGARGHRAIWPEGLAHRAASALAVLRVLTRADFRARYRAQALGVVWSLLYPLVMMAILSLIFTRVFQSRANHFPVFVLIGLVFWQWVTNSISAATQVFVQNADIIKRTVLPRQLLPITSVLSYAVNAAMESVVLLAFIPIFPNAFRLTPALLIVPLLVVVLALLLVGIGLATSVLNVIYRDVAYIVNTALLLLYWLTPVIYPPEVIPQPYQRFLGWNPLGAILTALRRAVMEGSVPGPTGWMVILLPTTLIFLAGWLLFRHYERMVLDYV